MSAQECVDPMPSCALTRQNSPRRHQPTFEYIFEMPLDIVLEIFSFLHPYDLLRLARTNKNLRRMLMSRSYRSLWKKCMAGIGLRVDDFEQRYQRATEPALINMLFCTACTGESTVQLVCVLPTLPFAIAEIRFRNSFATPHDMRYFIHPYFREYGKLWDLLPYALHEGVRQYRISDAIECTQGLWQLSKAEEREEWKRRRRDQANGDAWRVQACRSWMEAQMHDTRFRCQGHPGFDDL
uniref:F-box domain-containing protein n=1 Tax=Moniliophthora roreri TaxID=221103 RepID=A0A0W0G7T4_MONRR